MLFILKFQVKIRNSPFKSITAVLKSYKKTSGSSKSHQVLNLMMAKTMTAALIS